MRYTIIYFVFCILLMSSSVAYSAVNKDTVRNFKIACDLDGRSELERKNAIKNIIRDGDKNEEYFISMLGSSKIIERQIAAEVLGGLGGEKSEVALIEALGDKDVFLQGAAGRALAILYSRLPQEFLIERLRSTGKTIVSMAVMYGAFKKARYMGETLQPELIKTVSDVLIAIKDKREIQAAVMVLRYANTEEAVMALLNVAEKTSNAEIQIEICIALASIAPEGKAPQIESLAMSGKPLVEVEAWNALSAMGYDDADKALSGLAINPDPRVQARAIEYLADFGGKYDPLFVSALSSVDPEVRLQALYALKKTSSIHSASEIAKMMGPQGDRNPVVRARAALVFAELTHSGGLAPLLKDSRNNNTKMLEFRLEAIKALGELGDKGALRALIDMLRDDDILVRITATKSLGALDDKRAISKLNEMLKIRKGEEKMVLQEVIGEINN